MGIQTVRRSQLLDQSLNMTPAKDLCLLTVLILSFTHSCYCDLFTALADLEGTLRMEQTLSHSLRDYIAQEQDRLAVLAK